MAAQQRLAGPIRASSKNAEMFARFLAESLAQIGERDAAIDALADCVHLGFANYPFLAHHDRFLDPLRDHPRYQSILQTVRERWMRGGASVEDRAAPRAR
jgi:hypothetical protein